MNLFERMQQLAGLPINEETKERLLDIIKDTVEPYKAKYIDAQTDIIVAHAEEWVGELNKIAAGDGDYYKFRKNIPYQVVQLMERLIDFEDDHYTDRGFRRTVTKPVKLKSNAQSIAKKQATEDVEGLLSFYYGRFVEKLRRLDGPLTKVEKSAIKIMGHALSGMLRLNYDNGIAFNIDISIRYNHTMYGTEFYQYPFRFSNVTVDGEKVRASSEEEVYKLFVERAGQTYVPIKQQEKERKAAEQKAKGIPKFFKRFQYDPQKDEMFLLLPTWVYPLTEHLLKSDMLSRSKVLKYLLGLPATKEKRSKKIPLDKSLLKDEDWIKQFSIEFRVLQSLAEATLEDYYKNRRENPQYADEEVVTKDLYEMKYFVDGLLSELKNLKTYIHIWG